MNLNEESDEVLPEKALHIKRRTPTRYEKINKRFRGFITIIFSAIACFIAIGALRTNIDAPNRLVKYDSSMMVRIGDVSRVFTIKADPSNKSRLWFGAAEGLHVYDKDSMSWQRFGCDHGLPSDWVYDIGFFDGAVWAATSDGPAVMKRSSGRFRTLLKDTSVAFSVENAGDSMIVIYSASQGLIYYKNANDTVSKNLEIPGLKPNHVVTCLRYIDSTLFIGTELQELFAYYPKTHKSMAYKFNIKADGEAQVLDVVHSESSIWVATSLDGLYKTVSPDSLDKVKSFPSKGAFVLNGEKDGLWAGSPWGLWRYHSKLDVWVQFIHPKETNIGDFQVISLYVDSTELFYGTSSMGAGYFNKDQVSWHTLRAGLSSPNVAAIATSDSSVYTGYSYRGEYIDRFLLHKMQYEQNYNYNNGVGDPNIQALAVKNRRLYFGGTEGFGYLDFISGKNRYFSRQGPLQAYDITEIVPTDTLCFIGTVYGIAGFDPSDESFMQYGPTVQDRITCMYKSGTKMWYGTLAHGVKLYDIQKDSILLTVDLNGANRIMGIAPVNYKGQEMLFASTDRNGCYFIDMKNGSFTKCEISKDIAGKDPTAEQNEIRCMVKSDSLIWLGTEDAGCFVYDPLADKWGNFTFYEGLLSNKIRSFHTTEQYLYIGCFGGFHRIDKKHKNFRKSIFG